MGRGSGFGGEMEGCGRFMKYSLFLSNFVILIGGIAILAIGIWTKVDKQYMEELLGTNLYISAAYILIIAGVMVIIISFFGCLGAVKEVKCMLLTYFIITLGIFVVLLIGGILGYVFKDKVRETMQSEMLNSLRKYGGSKPIRDSWDQLQQVVKCCGVESYQDWLVQSDIRRIPDSCCRDRNNLQCQSNPTPNQVFSDGCLRKASDAIRDNAAIVGGVGIGIACLLLPGLLFSCALFKLIE